MLNFKHKKLLISIVSRLIIVLFILATSFFIKKNQSHNVIILSIPKMGTHLVLKTFTLQGKKYKSSVCDKIVKNFYKKKGFIHLWCNDVFELFFKKNKKKYFSFIPFLQLKKETKRKMCNGIKFNNREIIWDHFYFIEELKIFFEEQPKIKKIIPIRDLRDTLLSLLFFISKKETIYNSLSLYHKNRPYKEWLKLSFHKKLSELINNDYLKIEIENALYFLATKNTLVTKFENLVGTKGNGVSELQRIELKKIYDFANIKYTSNMIEKTAANLFGNTRTFRSGKIGEWKKHFTNEHKKEFKKQLGKYLIEFGYEKDDNW
jgi:sulfotransferase 6B1